MAVEGREQVTRIGIVRVNGQPEELDSPDGRRQPSVGGKSRVSREAQARFRERLGVQFFGPTRPKVGKGRARISGAKAFSFNPPHQGVCGWHGTEEQRVTSGGLAGSPGGTGVSRPISESEVASDALSVVGLPNSTSSAVKAA